MRVFWLEEPPLQLDTCKLCSLIWFDAEEFEKIPEGAIECTDVLVLRGREALAAGTYTRELSWEFHSLLALAAHNGAVEGLTQSFRSSLSMHPVRQREGAKAHAMTVEEHARILEALERRDGATARHEMALHLFRGTKLAERASPLLEWLKP